VFRGAYSIIDVVWSAWRTIAPTWSPTPLKLTDKPKRDDAEANLSARRVGEATSAGPGGCRIGTLLSARLTRFLVDDPFVLPSSPRSHLVSTTLDRPRDAVPPTELYY